MILAQTYSSFSLVPFLFLLDEEKLLVVVAKALGDGADVDAEHPVGRDFQPRDLVLAGDLVVEVARKVDHPLLLAGVDLVQRGLVDWPVVLSR